MQKHLTTRLTYLLIAFCIAVPGCKEKTSAFPLTIGTLQSLSPGNTSALAFEERNGDIYVTVVDSKGDGHIHQLVLGSTPKEAAIRLLQQKRAEIGVQ